MRTSKLAIAAVLTAAALSAHAAGQRTEPANSPFTYEVLGATPTLTFGRATAAAPRAEAPRAADAPKAASTAKAVDRTTGAAATPFTYDTLGATPHVETKKPAKTEALTPQR